MLPQTLVVVTCIYICKYDITIGCHAKNTREFEWLVISYQKQNHSQAQCKTDDHSLSLWF